MNESGDRAARIVALCDQLLGLANTNTTDLTFLAMLADEFDELAIDELVARSAGPLTDAVRHITGDGIAPAVAAATIVLLDHDRYAVRDFWQKHGLWRDLETIAAVSGQRLVTPA